MNPNAVTMNHRSVAFANTTHRRAHAIPYRFRSVPAPRSRPVTPSRPTLELSRKCAQESSVNDQWESYSLLFLGGCALCVVTGCLFHMERFVAHWDSFESFVRALVA